VVSLSLDTTVDVGVVDLKNGRPRVEDDVVEETLIGMDVLEGVVFVGVVIKEDKLVCDA